LDNVDDRRGSETVHKENVILEGELIDVEEKNSRGDAWMFLQQC
jgi:hypothetical protein